MKWMWMLTLTYSLLAMSCTTNRALPEEKVLFQDSLEGKWYLINGIVKSERGDDLHFSNLITCRYDRKQLFTAWFTTRWSAADSSFEWSVRNGATPFTKHAAPRFPLFFELPALDEQQGRDWYGMLKRSAWEQQISEGADGSKSNITLQFPEQKPFRLLETNPEPEIWSLTPAPEATSEDRPAFFSLSVLVEGDGLLRLARQNSIAWMDLYLEDQRKLSLLLQIDPQNQIHVLASNRQLKGETWTISADPTDTAVWTSPVSGKKYLLNFQLQLAGGQTAYRIIPKSAAQEIPAGKNSLWMGAMELRDESGNRISGSGNLYLLSP